MENFLQLVEQLVFFLFKSLQFCLQLLDLWTQVNMIRHFRDVDYILEHRAKASDELQSEWCQKSLKKKLGHEQNPTQKLGQSYLSEFSEITFMLLLLLYTGR